MTIPNARLNRIPYTILKTNSRMVLPLLIVIAVVTTGLLAILAVRGIPSIEEQAPPATTTLPGGIPTALAGDDQAPAAVAPDAVTRPHTGGSFTRAVDKPAPTPVPKSFPSAATSGGVIERSVQIQAETGGVVRSTQPIVVRSTDEGSVEQDLQDESLAPERDALNNGESAAEGDMAAAEMTAGPLPVTGGQSTPLTFPFLASILVTVLLIGAGWRAYLRSF